MIAGHQDCKEGSYWACSVCGRSDEELFERPGAPDKFCLGCSTDLAIAALLTDEIDAATLGGQNASHLVAQFDDLSARLLARSQSAELGGL